MLSIACSMPAPWLRPPQMQSLSISSASIVMNGTTIGARSLVAAGALSRRACTFRPKAWWWGFRPRSGGRCAQTTFQVIRTNAGVYVDLAREQEPAFPRD